MDFWLKFLPLIIYILLIILLVVGIILGIKTIITMSKVETVVDNVNKKVESLNSIFNIIDFTTDRITNMADKVVDFLANLFMKIWPKKRIKEEDENGKEE